MYFFFLIPDFEKKIKPSHRNYQKVVNEKSENITTCDRSHD